MHGCCLVEPVPQALPASVFAAIILTVASLRFARRMRRDAPVILTFVALEAAGWLVDAMIRYISATSTCAAATASTDTLGGALALSFTTWLAALDPDAPPICPLPIATIGRSRRSTPGSVDPTDPPRP